MMIGRPIIGNRIQLMNTQTRAELTTYRYPNDDNPFACKDLVVL